MKCFYRKSPFAVIFLLLIGGQALADRQGNGGDAVVCYEGSKITQVEFLDLVEGQIMWNLTPKMGSGSREEERALFVLERLKAVDLGRYHEYSAGIRDFYSNAQFKPGIELPDIPDHGDVPLPRGCKIEQAVIQKEQRRPEEAYFTVSRDLWELMSLDSRAALILHEIIYKEAIAAGHNNSMDTRYFTANLSSDSFESMDQDQYISFLNEQVHLPPVYRQAGVPLQLETVEFYPDSENPKSGNALHGFSYEYKFKDRATTVGVQKGSYVTFHANGNVESIKGRVHNELLVDVDPEGGKCNNKMDLQNEWDVTLRLYEDSAVASVKLSSLNTMQYILACVMTSEGWHRSYFEYQKGLAEFYPTGVLKSGIVISDTDILGQDGVIVRVPRGSSVSLNEVGELIEFSPR
ncbi:MAG: hypothetical protein AB7T49_14560 [Oligoflexales bacterium]